MEINLGAFPLFPLIFVLLIPFIYVLKKNRKELKSILLIIFCSVAVIIFYPITPILTDLIPLFGYTIAKFILFVFLPIITIFYIERWHLKEIFSNLGVSKKNIRKSVKYGILAAIVTIIITMSVSNANNDLIYRGILFFEAFTEEFFFRGFLFLYLIKKTDRKIAYATSILGFVLIHPQHFTELFLISTLAQGILLTIVTDKTENMTGAWIGHGLNRFAPAFIRSLF